MTDALGGAVEQGEADRAVTVSLILELSELVCAVAWCDGPPDDI